MPLPFALAISSPGLEESDTHVLSLGKNAFIFRIAVNFKILFEIAQNNSSSSKRLFLS